MVIPYVTPAKAQEIAKKVAEQTTSKVESIVIELTQIEVIGTIPVINPTAEQKKIIEDLNNVVVKVDLSNVPEEYGLDSPYVWVKRNSIKTSTDNITYYEFECGSNNIDNTLSMYKIGKVAMLYIIQAPEQYSQFVNKILLTNNTVIPGNILKKTAGNTQNIEITQAGDAISVINFKSGDSNKSYIGLVNKDWSHTGYFGIHYLDNEVKPVFKVSTGTEKEIALKDEVGTKLYMHTVTFTGQTYVFTLMSTRSSVYITADDIINDRTVMWTNDCSYEGGKKLCVFCMYREAAGDPQVHALVWKPVKGDTTDFTFDPTIISDTVQSI